MKTNTKEKVYDHKHDGKPAPQGTPIGPMGPRKANGEPDLSPVAGYEGHYPVQFVDEDDATFAARVAMFEKAYASALQNQAGGATVAQRIEALDAQYEVDKLNILMADSAEVAKREANRF